MRKPIRASMLSARAGSNIVRNERNSDTGLSGRVGSCSGERAAHRPKLWKIGSLS
jgi:hypothetical protein